MSATASGGEGSKTIKWQSGTVGGGTSTDGNNDSMSAASGFEEQSSRSGRGIFGFIFSPFGILLMFLAINYPWIKTLILGRSDETSPSTTPVTAPSTAPVSASTTPKNNAAGSSSSKWKMGSSASSSSSSSSSAATLLELSPACKNHPFKMIFDRNCRQEIKEIRMEKKREKLRLRQERQERKRRRREQAAAAALGSSSYANATTTKYTNSTKTTIPIIPIMDTGGPSSAKSSSSLKISNLNDLECNNILSRECRQKKRLMQQMKEALN